MRTDFSDVEYWNARFASGTEQFEWLKPPDEFLPHIKANLGHIPDEERNILHIGPGSSTLSLTLRKLVSDPQRVHNVDYSQNAVDLGKAMEHRAFGDTGPCMRWTCGNLLDTGYISTLANEQLFEPAYTLILDKSATDSIACGPDVMLSHDSILLSPTRLKAETDTTNVSNENIKAHPVVVLALHLAVLTSPGARWLCLSYSSERFPFFGDDGADSDEMVTEDPSQFWSLEKVDAVPVKPVKEADDHHAAPVYRPEEKYWLYTLKRTNKHLETGRA